jgi:hypothetical protein
MASPVHPGRKKSALLQVAGRYELREKPPGGGRIEYELEDGKLSRKAVMHQSFDSRSANVETLINLGSTSFTLKIRVDGAHVKITKEAGETIGHYVAQDADLHNPAVGKVGLKSNATFKVRRA